MRVGVGGRHVGVSARVPGPRSAHRAMTTSVEGVAAIILVPLYALLLVGWLLAGVLWLIGFVLKAAWWLILVVTAPIWGPIRGIHRHRMLKHARKQRRAAFATAPTGPRIG